jgi:hypothetical protein
MTPIFRVEKDGSDITPLIAPRLLSLSVTDGIGWGSDAMTLELADAGRNLEIPRRGARLSVYLGYAETSLEWLGIFVVDTVAIKGPPDVMTISCCGAAFMDADQGAAWQTRESRSWNTMTVDKMAGLIAQMHGVGIEVSITAPEIVLPQIEQTDESDLHMLLRIAAQHNLIVKPAVGKLIVMRRTDTATPGGTVIPTVTITPQDIASWDFDLGNRLRYNRVITVYHDLSTGQPVECTAGTGDVEYRHPGALANALDAQAAADAYLHAFQRGGATFSFALPGRGDLRADMTIALSGFRNGLDGDGWKIENAEHKLDRGGYSLSISGTNRTTAGAEAEQAATDEGFSTESGDGLTNEDGVEPITT